MTLRHISPFISLTDAHWVYGRPDEALLREATRLHPEVPPLLLNILVKRGLSGASIPAFLKPTLKETLPDPFHLKDMDKAVRRIMTAITSHEKIVVFGDYDVDGATSTSLLLRFFESVGVQADFYIPHREKEGYGPSIAAFQKIKERGGNLIITVDCGSSAFEPLAFARTLGMDVVVVDHHLGEDRLPEAASVLNPNRADETSPYTYLAAVGVSFLLVVALRSALRQDGFFEKRGLPEPILTDLLDLVALGTVADVMLLEGLNRTFVTQGLRVMAENKNIGLKALKDVSQMTEAPDAYHLGFLLGPRINAAGRIDDPSLGVRLLTAKNASEAQDIAQKLDALNKTRQQLEEDILKEAQGKEVQGRTDGTRRALCVAGEGWPLGVLGLIAGRLKEQFHRPVFALSWGPDGTGKGSGRSVSAVNLGHLIHQARDKGHLLSGGGHAMAGGIHLKRETFEAFQDFLEESLKDTDFKKVLQIDAVLSLNAITLSFLDQLEALKPFGNGNPRIRLLVKNVRIVHKMPMGKNHLRCTLESESGHRLGAVAFRAMDHSLGAAVMGSGYDTLYDVVGQAQPNTWQDRVTPQFILEDIGVGFSLHDGCFY